MAQNNEYVSLEHYCSALKVSAPALLGEIANQLRSILEPKCELNPGTVYVSGHSGSENRPPITYLDLSVYFKKATGRHVPVLFETPFQVVESRTVMVNRDWLKRKAEVAKEKLGLLIPSVKETVHSSQVLKMANASFISSYEEQPPALNSHAYSELYKKLAMQGDQRKAQEAASKDAIALRKAENRIEVLEALLAESKAQEKILAEENNSFYNEITAKNRKLQDKELEIERVSERLTMFANCFNPHSSLHPAALNECFECWNDITRNGTYDPSGPGGRGALALVVEWLNGRGETVNPRNPGMKAKRLSVIIGWRGAGSGAIRSR